MPKWSLAHTPSIGLSKRRGAHRWGRRAWDHGRRSELTKNARATPPRTSLACPSTQPLGQELLPPPAAHGLLGSQVGAGPEHAGGLARKPERHDRPTPMTGPKVVAEQLGRTVRPRPTHVGHPARRLAERELDEAGRHLIGVDWLELEAGRSRYHRQLCHLLCHHQDQVLTTGWRAAS